jgi:methionyl-tRNA formyltransferase
VPFLRACAEESEVVGVVTAPDRPKGRGRQVEPSPVKVVAEELGVPVHQPHSCRAHDFVETVAALRPDIIVAVAYGQLIPASVTSKADRAVNVHFSLLPQLRGAAPIQRALELGFSTTGVTVQLLAPSIDSGDVLCQEVVPIRRTDDAVSLMDRAVRAGVETIRRFLSCCAAGTCPRAIPQSHDLATTAPKWSAHSGHVRWPAPAGHIGNVVAAAAGGGGAYCFVSGARLKMWRSRGIWPILDGGAVSAGQVVLAAAEGLLVSAGAGALLLTEGQREGRRRSRANELVSGLGAQVGDTFADEPGPV